MAKFLRFCGLLLLLSTTTSGCGKEPLGQVASDGVVTVRFISGKIGQVPLLVGKTVQLSPKDVLQIQIWIENNSESAKVQYKGWGCESLTSGANAVLKDDLGNEYKPVSFGLNQKPIGQKEKDSLYPGTGMEDVLVFEVPVKRAQTMLLSLPRKNYLTEVVGPRLLELAIPVESFHAD